MRLSIVAEVRAECKRLGIPFDAVRDAKRAMQDAERAARERNNEIRQVAWGTATSRGCWPFWRFGFRARWGRRYDENDHTAIPGYDLIHQVVASQFPEFDTPDGECRLFEFLMSPYERFTPPAEMWWQAVQLVANQAGAAEYGEPVESSYAEF